MTMSRAKILMIRLFLAGISLSAVATAEEQSGQTTTGSRSWAMADGATRKLRFVEFGNRGQDSATFQWGAAPGVIPLNKFSPESRAFLNEIRDGRITLFKTPGLSADADFPAGPLLDPQSRTYRVGDAREWNHKNGRKLQASLVNLNDEVVSLLIGEKAWSLQIGDLSDADKSYLEEVKAGRARTLPLNVSCGVFSWEEGRDRCAMAKGHQVIGEPANDRRFEEAMAKAIETVRGKLDEKYWEFHLLSELPISGSPTIGWSLLAPPNPDEIRPEAVSYHATFRLTVEGRNKAESIWPLSVTPKSWKGPHELVIDLAPNAELANIQPIAQ